MPFQPVSLEDLYGFSAESLKFILSYLKNRKQRTVIENSYSSWEEIRAGVQQGSILVSFLFNIFFVDLFLFPKICNIANCTDYNILYATGDCFEVIIEKLSADLISNWNYENYMILNPKKNVTLYAKEKISKLFDILISRKQQQKTLILINF